MAGTIHVLGEGGAVFELSLPLHESIADKMKSGQIRRVKPDGSPFDESERPDGVPTLSESRPNVNATKAEWIGWAVKNGATVDDAEAATKADLIDKYGVNGESAAPVDEQPADDGYDPDLGDTDLSESHLEGEPGEVTHNENREDGQPPVE